MERKININELASHLGNKLVRNSPMSAHSCIHRIPRQLRRYGRHVFEPTLVSIGPYHQKEEKLQPMQEMKLWYLDLLIARAPTPETSLKCFTKSIMDNVNHCLECYAEKVDIDIDDFVEMMIVDGCFIIEYLRKYSGVVPVRADDPLFKMSWMRKAMTHDLLLLENQLPWFVLDCLFNLTTKINSSSLSLVQLADRFLHTDTLRFQPIMSDLAIKSKHLLDLQRNIILRGQKEGTEIGRFRLIPCVKELLRAGVKFKVGEAHDLLRIEFENGVLKIPRIKVLDNTESFFRNIIAYEQCDSNLKDRITSYAGFLNNLITSNEDLDHLRQVGIIRCYLSTEDVSCFFKRLYNDAHLKHSPYDSLSLDINNFCRSRWPRWRAILVRDYFSSPWSIISLIAGVIILLLTTLQSVFTVIS